ncbi:sugar phosphate isomerase/epimerase [Parabacteroides sp. PF5-6]|uniref:sugar phosphate isomerase/epimerase family protein n=1 Tax=Parabacteroides sp. PF5-6 TaxID=1742403 RepID=UPI00240721A4|nr:sugar phosphate isomerase/epimerase [Parabacteroides sp. PF5-6]MDF9828737.1 inosose dehydratase [Parabacteroides sp. PF5-6]
MIKIANAPCSWGVLEFELEGEAAGYEQVLDEMKACGYAGTELGDWGFMPTDPKALRAEMDKRDFHLLGAFVPVLMKDRTKHDAGVEQAVKTARLMADAGFPEAFIVLADENGSIPERTQNAGRVTPAMGLSTEEWKTFAEGADRIAREVKKQTGLRTVFHHHCGGYVETPEEIATLLTFTDPEQLGLVLDMGHYMFGGGDPLQALRQYADRIWHIHFKDCDPAIAAKSREEGMDYFQSVNSGVFCELGKGAVDFQAIVAELHQQNYDEWIVVEQDVLPGMGNPKTCAQRNREFIKTLGL